MNIFQNFISLGYYCGVAASMSKLGIRSVSGPFDWYISNDFERVINCIKNDFDGFLEKENLELLHTGLEFRNNKYLFHFGHEIKVSFEDEYEAIYNKYMRRIAVFREQIKKRSCFIRAISSDYELDYIKKNMSYIDAIIKKDNPNNAIIYIVSNTICGDQELSTSFYRVNYSYKARNMKELRSLFDSNPELIKFCIDNFDENSRYKNLVFDLRKEFIALENRYDLMTRIDRMDVNSIVLPNKIIIYGAGAIGKHFYQRIKKKCEVIFFMDKSPKEESYEGIKVVCYGNLVNSSLDIPIIVTPCYAYTEIRENLLNMYKYTNIISLNDLLE